MCLGAIFWARISIVYYGATDNDAARGGFNDKIFYEMIKEKNRYSILHQIDRKVNAELFDKWSKKNNKNMY
jgi:tRNA(Arg) A34 adenosine deaminase TadA